MTLALKKPNTVDAKAPIINKNTLLDILTTVRPAGSQGEIAFCQYITEHLTNLGVQYTIDSYGNIIVNMLPSTQSQSRVMFTAHTDTVHATASHGDAEQAITQQITYLDCDSTIVGLSSDSPSTCLGADDGTGVWVLLSLIQAKIPALYLFFRDEEIGGLGSKFFRDDKNNLDLLSSLTHCISFDRKGYHDIITEQWNGVCASDEFAAYFADAIKNVDNELSFSKAVGTFTDSANFSDIISECTNVSVGYANQHTENETQDIAFAEKLVRALVKMDWLSVPHFRNPNDATGLHQTSLGLGWADDDYGDMDLHIRYLQELGYSYAEDLVFQDPYLAAELLACLARK